MSSWFEEDPDIPEWYRTWWKNLPHVPKTLLRAVWFAIFAAVIAFAIWNSMYGGS